jgi:ribosomal protein L16 Arg81 hydroxylase
LVLGTYASAPVTHHTKDGGSLGESALDAAKNAVNAAMEQVDQIGQHFKRKVEATTQPETFVEMLRDTTKAAPLVMLAAAFIGGILYARRR